MSIHLIIDVNFDYLDKCVHKVLQSNIIIFLFAINIYSIETPLDYVNHALLQFFTKIV